MSQRFLSILISILLASFMFVVACNDDDDDNGGGGGCSATGDFELETGPDLSETELNNTLNDGFSDATSGLTADGSEKAQNALVGVGFAQTSIATVTGVLADGGVFDGTLALAKSTQDTTIMIDLGNGVTMTMVITDVATGHEFDVTADGTCLIDETITFSNTALMSGFLSSNFRNGDFTYNVGNMFDALFCGEFEEGDFDGTWTAEWSIAEDGTVLVFVDLDFSLAFEGTTIDYDYVAEITINPDGSGRAVGSIKISLDGSVISEDTFDVTWS